MPTLSRMIWPWALGGLVVGCGGTGPIDSVPTAPREVGSVGLFVEDGPVTAHVALDAGQTVQIEVRLYAADGVRILPADGDVVIQFTFDPPTFATAGSVPGSPLHTYVTPTADPMTPGRIFVTCRQTNPMVTKQFGPFDSLIH